MTDRVAAHRQLIIFDTGHGDVIQTDYYKNFFSDNPSEAYFTRKNRIVICPEYYSGESIDKDDIRKGDMFKVISSLPDSLNVFTLFDDTLYKNQMNSPYKLFMKNWYEKQLGCIVQIKVLRELQYLQVLTAIKPATGNGKRGIIVEQNEKPGDSTFSTRKKKALIIATNVYDARWLWDPLSNAINDGKAIAEVLSNQYGYEVITLFNQPQDSIMDAISAICNEAGNPFNQYVIYFAGHGYYDPKQQAGYVVCKDSKGFKDKTRPTGSELKTYLDYTILFKQIDASLNKVVLITDVCFGGTSVNSQLQTKTVTSPDKNATANKNPYKRVLSSGIKEVDDFVRLHNGEISPNSPFATSVLDIIKKNPGELSFEGLFSEISKVKPKLDPMPVEFLFGENVKPNEFVF